MTKFKGSIMMPAGIDPEPATPGPGRLLTKAEDEDSTRGGSTGA